MAAQLRDGSRVTRLISLAYILSTRTEIHIDELVERLGVSRKKLESDLNVLMFCGLPPYSPEQLFDITIEDDFVSLYFNDVFISPLRLNVDERAQVLVALSRLKSHSSQLEKEKIESVAQIIDEYSDRVVVDSGTSNLDKAINDAIEKKYLISFTYLSLSSATLSVRTVEPRVLYTTASISYLYAYDPYVKDYRIFRSDRIYNIEPAEQIADVTQPTYVDIDEDATQLFVENRDNYCDLLVDHDASWVLDSYPHETRESGCFRFYTPSPFFIARLLLSNHGHVAYAGGTFSRESIVDAVEHIRKQMDKTSSDTHESRMVE